MPTAKQKLLYTVHCIGRTQLVRLVVDLLYNKLYNKIYNKSTTRTRTRSTGTAHTSAKARLILTDTDTLVHSR